MKENKKQKVKVAKIDNKAKRWIIKISLLAFFISLLLSIISESIQNSGIIVAVILIIIFMALNVVSDMFGLAITSCQIEHIDRDVLDEKIKNKCKRLIVNADKVSSILCDVVGDICGILCGVSGSILSSSLSNGVEAPSLIIFIGALVSALIAGTTVLFKAISKNYAVNNAHKIVLRIGKLLDRFSA